MKAGELINLIFYSYGYNEANCKHYCFKILNIERYSGVVTITVIIIVGVNIQIFKYHFDNALFRLLGLGTIKPNICIHFIVSSNKFP